MSRIAELPTQSTLLILVLSGVALLILVRSHLRETRVAKERRHANEALSSIAHLTATEAGAELRPTLLDELLRLSLDGVHAEVGGIYAAPSDESTPAPDDRPLTLVAERGVGLPERVLSAVDAGPVGEAARTRQTVVLRKVSREEAKLGGLPASARSWRALPLGQGRALLGVLVVGFPVDGAGEGADLRLLEIVAKSAASVLNAGRLAESGRRARLGVEQARRQLALLALGSKALVAGLDDHEAGLRSLVTVVVPDFATWCAIDLVREGELHRVVASHDDRAVDAYDAVGSWGEVSSRVLVTGRSELAWVGSDGPTTSESMIAKGISTYLVVPIRLHGRAVGTISCGTAASRRGLRSSDVTAVEELAERVATLLERVSLYKSAERAAASADTRARQLRRLMDGAIAIHAERGTRMAAEVVAEHVQRVLSAGSALVVVTRPGVPPVRLSSGRHAEATPDWPLDDGDLFDLARAAQLTGRAGHHLDAESGDVVGLVAPLNDAFGETVGFVAVADKRTGSFTDDDEPSLVSLAQMASIGLENAHLYETLRSGENRLVAIIEEAPVAMIELDMNVRPRLWNAAAADLLGRVEQVDDGDELTFHPDTAKLLRRLVADVTDDRPTTRVDGVVWRPDGTEVPVSLAAAPLRTAAGDIHGVLVIAADVTVRRALDDQLLRAQRLEAIGQLAGGVAHDFNNLLTVILGHADLLELQLGGDHEAHRDVLAVRSAAERAAAVTSQLLTISRGDLAIAEVFDPRDRLRMVSETIRSLIAAGITLDVVVDPGHGAVRLAPGQFDQVLLNLAINARDAMSDGGNLTIRVSNDDAHVRIDVIDTGEGMDAVTLERCFEPFFTTKGLTRGTGLGLATVYSVVTGAGGHVAVESEPGEGTHFTVELPRSIDAVRIDEARPVVRQPRSERILLAEDEDGLRWLATEVLRSAGYVVTAVPDGRAALEVVAATGECPDLLITDVVMPRLNGVELARQLTKQYPGLPVLFVSGYAETATRDDLKDAEVLAKPFLLAELTTRVAEVIERSIDGAPA